VFFLKGDLHSLSQQAGVLEDADIAVRILEKGPAIDDADVPKALRVLWVAPIPGWENYKDELIQHGICTAEEFERGLEVQV
jgi:hypothetical protein